MTIEQFIDELAKINIKITNNQLSQLEKYYELLVEWNEKINLTGITEKGSVYLKHFYDSLTINKIIDLSSIESLCDIGTGAGFPGLVLKIVFPNLKVTLVDSLNKRINFLNDVINKLNLSDIVTIHSRVEDFGKSNREQYDLVTARAVASLNILLEYCIPLTKLNKYFVAMKSNISQEILDSKNAQKKLNCVLLKKIEFNLPYEESQRSLVVFKKEKATNELFPRRPSEIKKKPL